MQKATKKYCTSKKNLMNVLFDSQFKYRKKIESSKVIPKIIYYDKESSFRESLKRVSSVSIHERSAQILATEIYKVKNNNSPTHMNKTFEIRNEHPCNL